jgi:hypothetical protein
MGLKKWVLDYIPSGLVVAIVAFCTVRGEE